MGAWTEYNGYWYDIQQRSDCFVVYIYDSLQKKVYSAAADSYDDARIDAEDWIDNEAE